MNPLLRLAILALTLLLFPAFSFKPDLVIRFFVEANERDTDRFATPIQLKHPPRSAFVEKVATISEKHVRAIYPYPAGDGSWGCSFQLDPSGRLALEIASTEHRGRSMVAFFGTKKGTHQVIDMIIDQKISDGLITIQRGLTDLEVTALKKKYRVIGEKKRKAKKEKKRSYEAGVVPPPADLPTAEM